MIRYFGNPISKSPADVLPLLPSWLERGQENPQSSTEWGGEGRDHSIWQEKMFVLMERSEECKVKISVFYNCYYQL